MRIFKWVTDTLARYGLEQTAEWLWRLAFSSTKAKVGTGATGAAVAGVTGMFSDMPWPVWLLFVLLVFAILLVVIYFISKIIQLWWRIPPPPGSSIANNNARIYEDRRAIELEFPLNALFESAQIIWAVWVTGSRAYAQDVHKINSLKRLLLPNPEIKHEALSAVVSRDIKEIKTQSFDLSKAAASAGVEVRWYGSNNLLCGSLIIGEPYKDEAWAQYEPFLSAKTDAQHRPIIRITKKDNPTLFENFLNEYQAIWEQGKPQYVDAMEVR